MKKLIGIALVVALMASLCFGSVALAYDPPTTVTVDWGDGGTGYGSGWIGTTVTAGDDATTTFSSGGSLIKGSFTATDWNDDTDVHGLTYGVDNFTTNLRGSVTDIGSGWGFIEFQTDRTDSGPYGPPGQSSYTYVGVNDGSATLQNRSVTNYAYMGDWNFGWHNNDHITVTGATYYTLNRYMSSVPYAGGTLTSNFAALSAWGTGDVDLDCMMSKASAGQVQLGWGGGCYTNADASFTGSGQLTLTGVGNNQVTFNNISQTNPNPGPSGGSWTGIPTIVGSGLQVNTSGLGAALQIITGFTNGLTYPDYSMTAN